MVGLERTRNYMVRDVAFALGVVLATLVLGGL